MSDCLFCKMIDRKIPAVVEYENDSVIAIRDIHPKAPVHLLVIPKKHIACIGEISQNETALLGELVFCAKELAKQKKVENGFRFVFNNGAEAGQSVFHIHLHLLGGRPMGWPPG